MGAMVLEVDSDADTLSFQIEDFPEQRLLETLIANSTDNTFNKRMRWRYVRNNFDFNDIQDAQLSLPPVMFEERSIFRASPFLTEITSLNMQQTRDATNCKLMRRPCGIRSR